MSKPLLFTPFKMRSVVAQNRSVVSPMVQYRATDGLVNDYHLVHLGKFALGKFGIIFTENCAVVPEGRVTQGDLGMWDDGQIEGHKRMTRFIQQEGLARRHADHPCRPQGLLAAPVRQAGRVRTEGRGLGALAGLRAVRALGGRALLGAAGGARRRGDGQHHQEIRRGRPPC